MGNAVNKDKENEKNLILLDDSFINNFKKENNLTKSTYNLKEYIEKEKNNLLKEDNFIENKYNNPLDNQKINEKKIEELKKQIINDLIIQSEKYLNENKNLNTNDKFVFHEKNNICKNDEKKIYDCLNYMTESTNNFVNSYTKCDSYLRMYENCVKNIKM